MNQLTVKRLFEFIAGFLSRAFPCQQLHIVYVISVRNTGSLAALPGETGGVIGGTPLRGKMGRGVLEESEHLTGDQKGFHTSCGRLFRLIPEFIPGY